MDSPRTTIGNSAWNFQTISKPPSTSTRAPIMPTSVRQPLIVDPPAIIPQAAPQTHQSSECLSRSCIAPAVRSLFSFDFFNRMQSTCLPELYGGWNNCVIGAPTAAGKTVCFELALASYLNLRVDPRAPSTPPSSSNVGLQSASRITPTAASASTSRTDFPRITLYLAPLKSLVQERWKDWRKKLQPLGVTCQELTGDVTSGTELSAPTSNVLYLATPERWDSITRKWKENSETLNRVGLILIDEVHLLGGDRGAILEAVITRTMIMSHGLPPRFIALSASSPNVSDIGQWLKAPPNCIFYFGEEHRPIAPKLHVLGYQSSKNEYFFDRVLDTKLWGVIQQYSEKKPTLVFASSRKATTTAACKLVESCAQYGSSYVTSDAQKERLFAAAKKVSNDLQLSACILSGIGFHHAGMTSENRLLVESLFATGQDLMVVIATSTLAVGVNLPAYLVVIKSTSYWTQANGVEESSPLQIRQMIGRAGRPQFGDSSAAAVIMTQQSKVSTYESILECDAAPTESHLHKHLTDVLLHEIELGSISSFKDALTYVGGTYLAVRAQLHPENYIPATANVNTTANLTNNAIPNIGRGSALPTARALPSQNSTLHPILRALCMSSLASLTKYECISVDNHTLRITELGHVMSRYFVSHAAIQAIFEAFAPDSATSEGLGYGDVSTRRLLEVLCSSPVFSETLVRRSEKKELREVSALTRFPLKAKGIYKAEKISILIQSLMVFLPKANGNASLPFTDTSLKNETEAIATSAVSLLNCLIQFFIDRGWFYAVHKAILLLKSIRKRCWVLNGPQTRQIPIINGEMAMILERSGCRTLIDLLRLGPERMSQILSCKPDFTQNVLIRLHQIPYYSISVQILEAPSDPHTHRQALSSLVNAHASHKKPKMIKILIYPINETRIGSREKFDHRLLALGQSGKIIHFQHISILNKSDEPFLLQRPLPELESSTLEVLFVSDEWIGFDIVGTVSLSTPDIQHLEAHSEHQDPYNEDSSTKNSKKRKTPTPKERPAAASNTALQPSPTACNHRCKNKFICKHACCRLHPDVRASGNLIFHAPSPVSATISSSMPESVRTPPQTPARNQIPTIQPSNAKMPPPPAIVARAISHAPPEPKIAHPSPLLPASNTNPFAKALQAKKASQTSTTAQKPINTISSVCPPQTHPMSPQSVSPIPSLVNFAQDSPNDLNIATTISQIVTTRPGRLGTFLPSSTSTVLSPPFIPKTTTSVNTLTHYGTTTSSSRSFNPPALRPTAKPASEISRSYQVAAASQPYDSNLTPSRTNYRSNHPSAPNGKSILAPAYLNHSLMHHPSPVRPYGSSLPASQAASGWKALLDWELDLGLRPEP